MLQNYFKYLKDVVLIFQWPPDIVFNIAGFLDPCEADNPGRREVSTGGADGKGKLPAGPGGHASFAKPAGLQPVRHMNAVQEPVPARALRRS